MEYNLEVEVEVWHPITSNNKFFFVIKITLL